MKNIKDFFVIKKTCEMTKRMYEMGWDERNGGNVSVMIDEKALSSYMDPTLVKRSIDLTFDASELANKIFLVTATGSFFRKINENPEEYLGIFRISEKGNQAHVLWGYENNNRFTSELPTHLMVHAARLRVNPNNRVVMHCHPTNLITMSHVHPLTDKEFTLSLWRTMTESIVVFPEGVGVLPWMQSGTNEIGEATSNKIKEYRLVLWGMHGIHAVGETLDDAFGLIEVAEKSAQIHLESSQHQMLNNITNDQLKSIADFYQVKHVKFEFLE